MASLTRSMSTMLNGLQVDEAQFRRDVDRLVKGATAAAKVSARTQGTRVGRPRRPRSSAMTTSTTTRPGRFAAPAFFVGTLTGFPYPPARRAFVSRCI